jgi:cytochrome P450
MAGASDAGARSVVDEVLRFEPSIQLIARQAAQDVEVADRRIGRGDRVLLLLASANRDPARFERPDEFAPGRADRLSALGFGIGPHHCPGSGLARTEAAVAVRALLNAVGAVRLAREPCWKNSFTFRGPVAVVAQLGGG